MFGYIAINKAEMKFKDFDVYHSYYCGLCKRLKERYGRRGQMTPWRSIPPGPMNLPTTRRQ